MKNRSTLLFIIILALAAFFRFYHVREYLIFLGDEGRDVLIVKQMIVNHKFTLLGPITSVGSMYTGPVYYYMMAPFLWLFNLDPVGPAIMVVLVSLATVFLIYKVGSEFFSKRTGLISAFLYAISPFAIVQGKSSWNPNVVPFFSMLLIFGLCKVIIQKKYRWLAIVGIAFGISVQLHYISLLLGPVIFITILLKGRGISKKYLMYLLGGFFVAYSPFLIFELRHSFTNSQAVIKFLRQGGKDAVIGYSTVLATILDIAVRLFWRLVVIVNAEVTKLVMIGIGVTLVAWNYTQKKKNIFLQIMCIWLFTGLLCYGLYRGSIYDYYMVPIFPIPFLLTGMALDIISRKKILGLGLSILILISLVFFNLRQSPLLKTPNNQVQNTQDISRFVFEKANGKPYNFALLSGHNSDHAYRYFFDIWGRPPVPIQNPTIDPDRTSVTEQLLIVCEEKECKPLGHPLWEIAGFGRAQIIEEWQVSTVTVFKLGHFNSEDQ